MVDLQFTLFNLLALFWAVSSFIQNPAGGLPDIPDGLAGLTSVSALTYIGNKAVQRNVPWISSLTPASARPGEIVTIRGAQLMPAPSSTTPGDLPPFMITVGGQSVPLDPSVAPTSSTLAFRVPTGLPVGQEVDVTITARDGAQGTASATTRLKVVADEIKLGSVAPPQAAIGGQLVLDGWHFLDPLNDQIPPTVIVDQVSAPLVGTVTDTRLTVTVPVGDGQANGSPVTVKVTRPGLSSNEVPLQMQQVNA